MKMCPLENFSGRIKIPVDFYELLTLKLPQYSSSSVFHLHWQTQPTSDVFVDKMLAFHIKIPVVIICHSFHRSQQEQQRVAVGPGNAQFISQVSPLRRARRCFCSSAAADAIRQFTILIN